LLIGVRPEGVLVARQETAGHIPVEAHIIEPLGAYDIVDLKIGSGFLRARTASGFVGKPGEVVWARLDPARTHFFDSESGRTLKAGAEA
jgi:multiple sugar transport system ATP-binding protein